MLLEGKKILVTGVITDQSIAFSVAKLAIEQGAFFEGKSRRSDDPMAGVYKPDIPGFNGTGGDLT